MMEEFKTVIDQVVAKVQAEVTAHGNDVASLTQQLEKAKADLAALEAEVAKHMEALKGVL